MVVLALLAFPYNCLAQSNDTLSCTDFSCCIQDLSPAGTMISHAHNKKEWMISYRYMNMYMHGVKQGTMPLNNNEVFLNYMCAPEKMTMQMHMLMAMYGITDRITVMAMFNYLINSMDMDMFVSTGHHHPGSSGSNSSAVHTMRTTGIGDLKLIALYGIFKNATHQLLFQLGVNLPTGNIGMKGGPTDMLYADQHYPYEMQLGSGTTDVLPGIAYLFQKTKCSAGATISGTYRTGYNSLGYKLGNDFSLNAWYAYKWLNFLSSSIRAEGIIAEHIYGFDPMLFSHSEPSANPFNYGGRKINCYIGSSLHFKGIFKNNRLALECGVPLYQYLKGIQLQQQYTLQALWSYSF